MRPSHPAHLIAVLFRSAFPHAGHPGKDHRRPGHRYRTRPRTDRFRCPHRMTARPGRTVRRLGERGCPRWTMNCLGQAEARRGLGETRGLRWTVSWRGQAEAPRRPGETHCLPWAVSCPERAARRFLGTQLRSARRSARRPTRRLNHRTTQRSMLRPTRSSARQVRECAGWVVGRPGCGAVGAIR